MALAPDIAGPTIQVPLEPGTFPPVQGPVGPEPLLLAGDPRLLPLQPCGLAWREGPVMGALLVGFLCRLTV